MQVLKQYFPKNIKILPLWSLTKLYFFPAKRDDKLTEIKSC